MVFDMHSAVLTQILLCTSDVGFLLLVGNERAKVYTVSGDRAMEVLSVTA